MLALLTFFVSWKLINIIIRKMYIYLLLETRLTFLIWFKVLIKYLYLIWMHNWSIIATHPLILQFLRKLIQLRIRFLYGIRWDIAIQVMPLLYGVHGIDGLAMGTGFGVDAGASEHGVAMMTKIWMISHNIWGTLVHKILTIRIATLIIHF